MAQYDGSIRINTKIDTKGFKDGEKEIESESRRMAESVSKTADEIKKDIENIKNAQKSFLEAGGKKTSPIYQQYEKEISELQNALQSLKNTQDDTAIADEHWNLLRMDVEEYAKSLKELHDQGKFFGDEDYDQIYLAWKNATDAVKAYQTELNKKTESGQAKIAEQEAKAAEKKEAAQRRAEEQAEKALQKENARIQKQAENEAKLAAKEEERKSKEEARIAAIQEKEEARRAKEVSAIQEQEAEEQRLAQIKESAVVGNQRIVEVTERRKQLVQEIADMEKAGVGAGYQQYDLAVRELAVADQEIKDYNNDIKQVKESYSKLGAAAKKAFSVVQSAINKAGSGLKKFGGFVKSAFSNLTKSTQKSNRLLSTMASRFKGLALSLLIFNQISKAFNAMISGIKQGFGNMYKEVDGFKAAVDGLKASSLTLKNAFAAAFRPLVEIAIPYIQKAIEYITRLADSFGQLMAAITGQKTYTKAIKQTTAALEDAKEAEEGYLSPLDEINKFQKKESQSESGGATGTMFEENVPIKSSFIDMYENIKTLIENQNWDGIGAYIAGALNRGLQKIYDVINWDNVGPQITYFVTAFTQSFNSIVNNLDWDLIGRTIGAGINTIVNTLYLLITGIDWVNLGRELAEGMNGLANEVDAVKIGNLIGEKLMMLPRILLGFVSNLDWAVIGTQIGKSLNGVVSAIDLSQIGELLGRSLTSIFQMAINFAATFDWKALGTNIYQGINAFIMNTDWAAVGQGINSFALGLLDAIIVAIEGTDWKAVGEGIVTMLKNIDWASLGSKLFEAGLVLIEGLLEAFGELPAPVQIAIAAIGGFFAAFKAASVISGVVAAIKGIIAILTGGGGLSAALSAIVSFLGGPLTIAIGAIIAVGALLIANWDEIKEAAGKLKDWLLDKWESIRDGIGKAIDGMVGAVELGWSLVTKAVTNAGNAIKAGVKLAWDTVTGTIKTAIETIKATISLALNIIKGIWDTVWGGMKKTIESVFGGIWSVVRNVVNTIIGAIEKMVNGIISGVNLMTRALNLIHFDVPDWIPLIGGKSFGFNLPELSKVSIPRLATGTVVPPNREFMAVLGDNKREPEVVSPISTIEQAVENVMSRMGGLGEKEIVIKVPVYIGDKQVYEATVRYGKTQQMSTGKNPFALGTT